MLIESNTHHDFHAFSQKDINRLPPDQNMKKTT